jgi:hypothetical protein
MARRHDVGERQQRRHQLVVGPHREHDKSAVRLRDPDGLTLSTVDAVEAVPAPVEARGVQPLTAKHAGSVRPHEGCDDQIPGLHRADLVARVFDDPDELVAHAAAALGLLHLVVGPEIAPADRRASDSHDGVGRPDQAGVRDVLDADVPCAVHDRRAHGASFLAELASSAVIPAQPQERRTRRVRSARSSRCGGCGRWS